MCGELRFKKNLENGVKEGILELIELILSIRFGERAKELLPLVERIKDLNQLHFIKELAKDAKDITEMERVLRKLVFQREGSW